jgi:hypothetical protein
MALNTIPGATKILASGRLALAAIIESEARWVDTMDPSQMRAELTSLI